MRFRRRMSLVFVCLLLPTATFLCNFISYYDLFQSHGGWAERELDGWPRGRARDVWRHVRPEAQTAQLQPAPSCAPFLLLVVCSAVANADKRATVRATWGRARGTPSAPVRRVFLLGTLDPAVAGASEKQRALELEASEYGDVVQEDFVDSYSNLTLKSVFMLKWARQSCAGARFIMKADDDSFVNVPALLTALDRARSEEGSVALPGVAGRSPPAPGPLLLGHLVCGVRPIDRVANKWYSPRYMYPFPTYPCYLAGGGYVLSGDALEPLYAVALRLPLFHLEDVFLTGMCARMAHVEPRDHPAFACGLHVDVDDCRLRDGFAVLHPLSPRLIRRAWLVAQSPPSARCIPPKARRAHGY